MPRKTSMLILSQTWHQKQRFLKRSCCWEVGAVARQSSFPLNLSTQTGFRQGGDSVVKVELGVKVSMCWVLLGLCLWCRSRDYRILIPAVRTIMCDGDVVAHSGSHGEEVRSCRCHLSSELRYVYSRLIVCCSNKLILCFRVLDAAD